MRWGPRTNLARWTGWCWSSPAAARSYETELASLLSGGRDRGGGGRGAGQHRCAPGLGEPLGGAVRVGGAAGRRAAVAAGRIAVQAMLSVIEADEKTEGEGE